MTNTITLQSSNFGSNEFTLIGDTCGGPPTNIEWRRNGVLFSDSSTVIITTIANPNNNQDGRVNCRYRSTAAITAEWPGVYEYSASNIAMSSAVRDSFTIEGKVCMKIAITKH